MKLSEMKQVLAANELRLTKSLGQNFLHDRNQLLRIVEAAQLSNEDRVLEIGPGLGPLTELLVERAGTVLAIEKDGRLVSFLEGKFQLRRNPDPISEPDVLSSGLHLVHDDALDFLRRAPRDWSRWKLVANLPYSVASPILIDLALATRGPERLVATLQIEVARRLTTSAGTPDYGVLTLLAQLEYSPAGWFKIPASCFFPEPDVDSACVCLIRRPLPLLAQELPGLFAKLVKRSFSQRRKMMLKLLKLDWAGETLDEAFAELGLDPHARAETVQLEQFVRLTQNLAAHSAPEKVAGDMSEEIFDVVNERDEVVGRETRREVHRRGLMHRAVHVLVFNSRGQVFLQKRSMQKDRQPGVWDSSTSGHLDSGEDYDDCAVRELREEIGLSLEAPPQRLFKLPASMDTDQEHVWIYRCEAEGPFTLHPEEIETGGWFAPGEVNSWMAEKPAEFASALLVIWKRLGEQAAR